MGGREYEPELRVAKDQRAQLSAGIAAGAENTDPDSLGSRRKIMHR
jgi:hypothetical protein